MVSELVTLPYAPRDYQIKFERAMFQGKKRALLVWHRRAGKDVATLNFMINEALKTTGTYYYFFPTFRQARAVIWDGIDESGKKLMDAIPKALIEGKPNETQMKIKLINGSILQLIGTDSYDAIAGTNPVGCVFSEYSLQDPMCWELIVSPILVKNGGWAVFNGTPRGKNHQYTLDEMARANPDKWFYQKLTIEDTKLIKLEDIEQQRKEGKSEELIQQEYYCSYERGIEGAYYARELEKARQAGRIGVVPVDLGGKVNTGWDLGYGDSTAIVFWQQVGSELRIIDYYEATGESLAHYVKVLQNKGYVYGQHFFPHDAGQHSLQTGKSLSRVAQDFGLNVKVLGRTDIESGIEAARSMLSVAFFDADRCKRLLKCLEAYHKRYNDKMGCYSNTPVHDWCSHGADAFRYAAVSRQWQGGGSYSGLTPERIRDMQSRHLGWRP